MAAASSAVSGRIVMEGSVIASSPAGRPGSGIGAAD
jgi:hypothetical protein